MAAMNGLTDSQIEQLVDLLGFKTAKAVKDGQPCLQLTTKNPVGLGLTVEGYCGIYGGYLNDFLDYRTLEDSLFNWIIEFKVSTGPKFKNPYLGCKTFEEALVRKDLCNV